MFPKNSTGVRRAHSFDSYDNLDKLDAVQEYRNQFLNTRAKFEKQSSDTPPQPPPRKHFGIKRQTSAEIASMTDDLFSRQLQTLQDDLDFMVKETEQLLTGSHKNKGLYSTNTSGEKGKKFIDSEPQSLSSPVLVRRQIVNNSQRQPANEPIVIKSTMLNNSYAYPTYFENVHLPSQNKSMSYGFERSSLTQEELSQLSNKDKSKTYSFERSKYKFEEPSELPKQDTSTSFKFERSKYGVSSQQTTSKSYDNEKNNFKPEEQPTGEVKNDDIDISPRPIPAQRKKTPSTDNLTFPVKDSLQSYLEYKEQIARKTWRPVLSPGVHRSRSFQSSTPYSSPVRPESDSERSRRLYLQSTLNNISSHQELLKAAQKSSGTSAYNTQTNGTVENSLGHEKPRRISTGSMHEPVVWRSRMPPMPVKTLAQKFVIERKD